MADRRTVGTLIVDKPAQYRLLLPFGLFWLMCVGLVYAVYKQSAAVLDVARDNANPVSVEALNRLSAAEGPVLWTALIGCAVMGGLCFAFWLVYSHRIFGPITPIRRHVLELNNGNYESQIQLRNRDEFTQLAEDLNQLAITLKNKAAKA